MLVANLANGVTVPSRSSATRATTVRAPKPPGTITYESGPDNSTEVYVDGEYIGRVPKSKNFITELLASGVVKKAKEIAAKKQAAAASSQQAALQQKLLTSKNAWYKSPAVYIGGGVVVVLALLFALAPPKRKKTTSQSASNGYPGREVYP